MYRIQQTTRCMNSTKRALITKGTLLITQDFDERWIKTGVISKNQLIEDVKHYFVLYKSGRAKSLGNSLHKIELKTVAHRSRRHGSRLIAYCVILASKFDETITSVLSPEFIFPVTQEKFYNNEYKKPAWRKHIAENAKQHMSKPIFKVNL